MHAKRTRDRKKQLVEVSEAMIGQMENESHALREYLVSLKLLSVEEAEKSKERASESQKELAALKVSATPLPSTFNCLVETSHSNVHFCCVGISKRIRPRWR